jgi:hypothetical protein
VIADGVAPKRILRIQFDELPSLAELSDNEEPVLRMADWFEAQILGGHLNETSWPCLHPVTIRAVLANHPGDTGAACPTFCEWPSCVGRGILPMRSPDMTREQRIEKFASAVQRAIVSCPNEQPWEGGEVVCWISGRPADLRDLLMNHRVPEDLQDEVVSRLRCPRCDSPLEARQEVGTKYAFEQQHEATVERALRKYREQLFEFDGFLRKFPMLGATHPFGKKILGELQRAAGSHLNITGSRVTS